MDPILIIGQNGQVSTYLQSQLAEKYSLVVAGRELLDLSLVDQIYPALESIKPALIINPAAYTAVDLAEQEVERAFLINRDAVAEIARYCGDQEVPLIHYSTDYVFAGDAERAYRETDLTAPTGVYGQSKLEGEQAILNSAAPAVILRTAWVYSNHGKNFYKTMLMLAESRDELSVVADQIGAPTYAGSIAVATEQLLELFVKQGGVLPEQQGIYHFSCQGQTSWCGFAESIFSSHSIESMTLNAVGTKDYPTPAARPAFSVLDNTKLEKSFGVRLPNWEAALQDCVAETQQAESS